MGFMDQFGAFALTRMRGRPTRRSAGLFREKPDDPPEMFRYSGLSYLTKPAPLELLATARAAGFKRNGSAPIEGERNEAAPRL